MHLEPILCQPILKARLPAYLKGRGASSPQSARGKGKEAWRGGTIVCMADGVLIGALSPRQRMLPNATFPFFSSDVVRGGSGVVRRIDVHLCSDVLPRGQDIQVG